MKKRGWAIVAPDGTVIGVYPQRWIAVMVDQVALLDFFGEYAIQPVRIWRWQRYGRKEAAR